ncbi:MAG: hypothetical protein KatS3mg024_2576 [Armatimonadota bacterium]|nr:MAG: hypothetical protein KatS3mg024_2576 [Armatimonadota bacterium]
MNKACIASVAVILAGTGAFPPVLAAASGKTAPLALDGGADGIEIDIRCSKDGVLLIHHDDVLGRIFAGAGPEGSMLHVARPYPVLKTFSCFITGGRQPEDLGVTLLAADESFT